MLLFSAGNSAVCSPNISGSSVSEHNVRVHYLNSLQLSIITLVKKIAEEELCVTSGRTVFNSLVNNLVPSDPTFGETTEASVELKPPSGSVSLPNHNRQVV